MFQGIDFLVYQYTDSINLICKLRVGLSNKPHFESEGHGFFF